MSNRKIFRKIAKENKLTVAEVKQDMQSALENAFKNPNNNGVIKAFQDRVPRKGEVPTPEEFIKYAATNMVKGSK